MKRGISTETKGVAAYLLIAFGLAWALWAMGLARTGLSGAGLLSIEGQAIVLSGAFAPAVAALFVRRWVTGEGFADAGLGIDPARWPYYAFALLWPLLAVASVVALCVALGGPDLSLARVQAALFPGEPSAPLLPSGLMGLAAWVLVSLVSAPLLAPVLWGEEFGWRGYLQVRLFADRPLLAAVVTGLIWGAWHYPLVLAGYGFFAHPDGRLVGLAFYPLACALFSVVFGWLRLKTGSIWAPSLAHSATNVVAAQSLLLLFAEGPGLVPAAMLLVVPYGALCVWIVLSGGLEPDRHKYK